MKFALGHKVGMTQIFDDAGKVVPATLVATGPLAVSQKKTASRDGYEATQVALTHGKKTSKREVRLPAGRRGGEVEPTLEFAVGDTVAVSGISKGKGFQGVVKRHGFHGGPRSHGQKHSE